MSSEFGPPSLNAPLFASNKPWLWALIPVGLVVIFGGLALWLHTQRRRAEAQRQREEAERLPYHAQNRDPRVAAAASAHLLPPPMSFASSVSSSPGPPPPPAVLGAPGTRWVRFNAASTRAREEGLNELGEAPPPYEPKKSDVNLPASGGTMPKPSAAGGSVEAEMRAAPRTDGENASSQHTASVVPSLPSTVAGPAMTTAMATTMVEQRVAVAELEGSTSMAELEGSGCPTPPLALTRTASITETPRQFYQSPRSETPPAGDSSQRG